MTSNEQHRPSGTSRDPAKRDDHLRPVSDRGLAIFMTLLALALVLGYLLLNKMVDISRQEDCILAHRRDCGATVLPFPN